MITIDSAKTPSLSRREQERVVLMSIKPCYWQKILDGSKRFELRRRLPKLARNDLIVVYASAPNKAVVGAFRVKQVVCGTPLSLWAGHAAHLGIARSDYFAYFSGTATALAIEVSEPVGLEVVPLDVLRQSLPGFRPPQSFMYWSEERLRAFTPALAGRASD